MWEGAAERLLRGFALSLLVPDEHYAAASELGQHSPPERQARLLPGAGRLPTWRCPARATASSTASSTSRTPSSAPGSSANWPAGPPMSASRPWRTSAACLGRSPRRARSRGPAVGTRRTTGAVSTTGPATCSAGPTNARSTPCPAGQRDPGPAAIRSPPAEKHAQGRGGAGQRSRADPGGAQPDGSISTEIDWQPLVNQIADLKAEKRDLEEASAELQRLDRELRQGQGADQLGRGRAEKSHREHRGSGQQDRVGSFGPGNGPAGARRAGMRIGTPLLRAESLT